MKDIKTWLEQQRKLLEAATPGPWVETVGPAWFDPLLTTQAVGPLCREKPNEDPYVQANKDAEFIASVRTEHERALKIIEKMREALEDISSGILPNGDHVNVPTALFADEALAYFPEMDK